MGENNINKELNNSVVDTRLSKYKANFIHLYAIIFGSPKGSLIFLPLLGPSQPPKALYLYLYTVLILSKQLLHACELARNMLGMGAGEVGSSMRKVS